jgi:cytochrome P450
MSAMKAYPKKQFFLPMCTEMFGEVKNLPKTTGLWLMGTPFVCFNKACSMEEIFVTKNVLFSKHELKRDGGKPLLYNNIVSMETDNPKYKKKRKAISSAFFKNKVRQMIRIVKETALIVFK